MSTSENPSPNDGYEVQLSEWELAYHVPQSVVIDAVSDPDQHSAALIPYNYIHGDLGNVRYKYNHLRSATFTGITEKDGETCCTILIVDMPGLFMRSLARIKGKVAKATVYVENYDPNTNQLRN